jgi:two-component system, OmpR family, response regulator CpxR
MIRVLMIDRDQDFCRQLEEQLIRTDMTVKFAHDAKSGLRSALSGEHDLVVVDISSWELSGPQAIKQLRADSEVGVLILSDRTGERDRILGLEWGADDYLAKPFNPRELIVRIQAISRRLRPWLTSPFLPASQYLRVGDVALDGGSRTCRRNAEVIDLTTAEFDLLSVLLRGCGHVMHRRDLSKRILEREYVPYDRSIDVHVSSLRRKLGALPDGTERIRAIRNVGYLYAHPAAPQSTTS